MKNIKKDNLLTKKDLLNFVEKYKEILNVRDKCDSMIEDLFKDLDLEHADHNNPLLANIVVLMEVHAKSLDSSIDQYKMISSLYDKIRKESDNK